MQNLIISLTILSYTTIGYTSHLTHDYEVYYEWKQVDYAFPSAGERYQSLMNGSFVQINCFPTGIKVYKDRMFVATPRYRNGAPSTLNVIPYKKPVLDQFYIRNQGPILTPFPSWEMQQIGNCSALQMVQTMELDTYDRLWILDIGRVDIFTTEPRNLCPAKLVIYDLTTNKIERVYEFPAEVVPRDINLIKDIQVACTSREDCFVYISNLNVTCSIVVYDYKNDDSWFATHSSMQPEADQANITIDGVSTTAPFGITGLGLTPRTTDFATLYFSKIAGDHNYRVPTSVLKDSATLKQNPVLPDNVITDLGAKSSGQCDGASMDSRGRWYFGSLPESAVYWLDTNGNPPILEGVSRAVQNSEDMQWPDAFAYDGLGNLLFTTVKFQRWAQNLINPQDVNYRIIRFKTDSLAYYT